MYSVQFSAAHHIVSTWLQLVQNDCETHGRFCRFFCTNVRCEAESSQVLWSLNNINSKKTQPHPTPDSQKFLQTSVLIWKEEPALENVLTCSITISANFCPPKFWLELQKKANISVQQISITMENIVNKSGHLQAANNLVYMVTGNSRAHFCIQWWVWRTLMFM